MLGSMWSDNNLNSLCHIKTRIAKSLYHPITAECWLSGLYMVSQGLKHCDWDILVSSEYGGPSIWLDPLYFHLTPKRDVLPS